VLVWKFNCACAVAIATEAVTAVVEPMSNVELSVYCTLTPFHTASISPILAFDALVTVYMYLAPVKEPVDVVNKLFEPIIDDATVAVCICEIPIPNPLFAYDAVAAYDAVVVKDAVVANDAVVATELETAYEDVVANEAVPNKFSKLNDNLF
jgi:hypothetical protein